MKSRIPERGGWRLKAAPRWPAGHQVRLRGLSLCVQASKPACAGFVAARQEGANLFASRLLHRSDFWVSIWVMVALAGMMLMVAPLVLRRTVTPCAQAQRPDAARAEALPASSTQQGGGEAQASMPIWMNVPKARIAGRVIPVGTDAHGAMAAPEGANSDPVWFQTFWWKYGPMPGQIGNAVIGGHLDCKDGSPAIFWNLRKLMVGDSVFVRTALGATLHFVVREVRIFANPTGGATDPVVQRIFGPAQTANLNLITCTGDWTGKEYTKKLVVFTTLVS
jgi:hypothetical protein